ncbi:MULTISPECIES: hypothetical protein [unclassified Pseudomonas]|uniref:hypothetical protein n=1 Tax=unclassified Pseudomonas TaxID=196821 RepID=UPI000BD1C2EA|nr:MULTISPECIES: hypothetical protein [unclassified Pseudomonas]PVZ09761.1 hypothetical protein F474_04334 [Pseudomonas sp. URIL14HWK12:I12]PVZ21483.1 hypothetical protein F470_04278 [Pseudomonas sp. URIL14HWK12:I10]PVZ30336.1 hypothetical protein F472_04337 [Pseudomonas sp. URIL14HWK12:I11]SNZ18633.1 hypothetical protein SAMN05660463_04211 [Pseudomonas sp. URIL14HWK12:I9]
MSNATIGVVGSGLVSFGPEIDRAQREAVTYALRFAHRAATDLYNESGGQWYDYYRRQLRFLGWDAQPADHAWNPDRSRVAVIDRAVEMIAAQDKHFAGLARRATEALKITPAAGAMLQKQARAHKHGMFQLLPCTKRKAPSGVSQVELLVYHEEMDLAASAGLFSSTYPPLLTDVQIHVVRFDVRSFEATHLPKIRERFRKIQGDYLSLLEA